MHIINFPDHGLTMTLINPVFQFFQSVSGFQNRANEPPLQIGISKVVFVN